MRRYVIEKITDEASEKFNNWDDVLMDEESNTEIIAEYETMEECETAWNDGNYNSDMYCIGIRN